MHALLIPVGSSGDVHPFVGLGLRLKRRGHRVSILTNGHFAGLVRRVGLEFIELGTSEEFLAVTQNPDLWHPIRGFQTVVEAFGTGLPRMYDAIVRHGVPGETVLVGSSLALSARVAEEALGLPLATVHLQPAIIRSLYKTPRLSVMHLPDWLPRGVKRGVFWAVDRIVDRLIGPAVNSVRRGAGLAPVRGIMKDWWHSPEMTIGLFPEWFSPPQPDWPACIRLTGFPLYDESGAVEWPEGLEDFLNAGDAPIVFTPGSAMRHGRGFFDAAIEACGRLGRRGILLTRFADQLPLSLPAEVRHFDFVPLTQLLPRAAALVCHGGIGTVAQGLAAGVPQLVMPLSHDQPDNAARVRALGVGDSIKPSRFRGARVATKLDALLSSEAVKRHCREVAGRFVGVDPLAQTCELIETLDPTRTAF
jgi:UDP:flavonoid glycosyltransferase YjiC (YdhE family)